MKRLVISLIALLAFLPRAAAQQELEAEDILYLVESGMSEEQIAKEIRIRRVKFRLTAETESEFQKKGLSDTILKILHEVQIVDDAIRMKAEGKGDVEIIRMIAEAGLVLDLGPDDLLLLRKKKVSIDIVNALQGNFTFRDFATHDHPGGFFRIQHPKDWRRIEEFEDDKTIVTFTPLDRPSAKSLELGFRIEMTVAGSDSPHHRIPLATINRTRMRQLAGEMKAKGQTFEVHGEPKKVTLLGVEGHLNEYDYKVGDTAVRRRAILLYHNGVEYWVAYDIPLASFDAMNPLLERMLLTFNPAPGELGRRVRKPTADPQKILETYRPSVVRVEALVKENGQTIGGGFGTGWFIRRDGYVLTNHHVVWDEDHHRYANEILLHWDDTLHREPVPARFVDAIRLDRPKIDIALLKAKGSDFLPMPVTRCNPANRFVKEQDNILALGYPGIVEDGKVVALTLTSTRGTLSKFNLLPDYKVETVIGTAVLQHGNSGGPCVDLETHSVIGLNTFFPSRENELAQTYGGIIPVDAAFEYFPEIISYPESVDVKFRAEDHLALAIQFHMQGLHRAALRQLAKAFSKKRNIQGREGLADVVGLIREALQAGLEFPEGFAAAGEILAYAQAVEPAQACFELALRQDPDNVRALRGLGLIAPQRALECAGHVIRLRPTDHLAYMARALVHEKEGRLDDAVADAKMSIECCAEMYSEPYCVLGRLMYAQKNYEEGRAQYEKATQIDPKSVDARFGVAQYFWLNKKYPDARAYIDSIAKEGKDDVLWQRFAGDYLYSMAGSYEQQGDAASANAFYDGAFEYYARAATLWKTWNQLARTETLIRFGWLALAKKKNYDLALDTYMNLTKILIDVRDGKRVNDPWLQNVYSNLGFTCRAINAEWLAGAFFQAAVNLDATTKDGKLSRNQLAGKQRIPLTQDQILLLLNKLSFSDFTIADLVMASPVAFKITPPDADSLAKKGWPVVVLQALLKQSQGSEAKGLEAILTDWQAKDKQTVQAAQKLKFEDRSTLFQKYYKAHESQDYRTSLPGFRMLYYRLRIDDPPLSATSAYNACCGYSLSKLKEEALDWFELCFYAGFFEDTRDMVAHVTQDRDLDNIRGEARFKIVLDGAKKLKQGGQTTQNNAPKVTMGVKLQNLTDAERQNMGLKAGMGVLVLETTPDGPAAKGGIVSGDAICKLDDDLVGDTGKFASLLSKKQAGSTVTVILYRGKEFYKADVEVASTRP